MNKTIKSNYKNNKFKNYNNSNNNSRKLNIIKTKLIFFKT